MLPSLKIRGKLVLSFSIAMILVLCTLGFVVYLTFASSTRIDKQKIAGLHLEVMTSELVQLAASERLSLRALEQNIADGASPEPLLRQYLRNTLYAEGVMLVDDRGVVRQSAGDTAAIQSLLSSGDATIIEPVAVGASIVLPGSDASELMEGRLLAAAQIGGMELLRSIEYRDLPAHSVVIIADKSRKIISNHEPMDPELEREFQQLVAAQVRDSELAEGGELYGMRKAVESLPVELWYLVPKKIFQADIFSLQNRVVGATIFLLWLTLWIVLAISHRITQPIRELTASIAAMKEEEYAVPLTYRDTGDETAALAKGFESMRQHIDELISVDPLTNLYNRRYLMRSFLREINRARRSSTPLCCMMLDIDRFKNINDNWGHPCGDYVLRQAAHIIKENIRDCDIAARFGGEEFMVLLPTARTAEALSVGLRIGQMLEEFEFVWEGESFHVTTSGGIASLDEIDGDEPEALLALADAALYEAKQGGRNRVIVNRPVVEALVHQQDHAA